MIKRGALVWLVLGDAARGACTGRLLPDGVAVGRDIEGMISQDLFGRRFVFGRIIKRREYWLQLRREGVAVVDCQDSLPVSSCEDLPPRDTQQPRLLPALLLSRNLAGRLLFSISTCR